MEVLAIQPRFTVHTTPHIEMSHCASACARTRFASPRLIGPGLSLSSLETLHDSVRYVGPVRKACVRVRLVRLTRPRPGSSLPAAPT